jgi:hypothetical protein
MAAATATPTPAHWAAPALALLRMGLPCSALLGGWVWLGWQGLHLGWPLAGGLGVVALWWALRLLAQQAVASTPGLGWTHWRAPLRWALGLATGAGVLLLEGAVPGHAGLPLLLSTAGFWALWSVALTPTTRTTSRASPAGSARAAPEQRSRDLTSDITGLLSTTAMGLMMGSLWLSSQWCASARWPAAHWVGAHLAFMLLMPLLMRGPARHLQAHPRTRQALPLLLQALGGACLLASQTPAGWMLGMALQALAWALSLAGQNVTTSRPAPTGWALLGPLLLLVGAFSTTSGPLALHSALAVLGALALLTLWPLVWRGPRHGRPLTCAPYLDTP